MKTYEDGLNEAWEMAKRIVCLCTDGGESAEWLQDVFGDSIPAIIIAKHSVSEAIKQVKEYENRIEVGDEVHTIYDDTPMVVVNIFNEDVTGEKRVVSVSISGIVSNRYVDELEKTGRHFPQIAEVLKQMQEGNE